MFKMYFTRTEPRNLSKRCLLYFLSRCPFICPATVPYPTMVLLAFAEVSTGREWERDRDGYVVGGLCILSPTFPPLESSLGNASLRCRPPLRPLLFLSFPDPPERLALLFSRSPSPPAQWPRRAGGGGGADAGWRGHGPRLGWRLLPDPGLRYPHRAEPHRTGLRFFSTLPFCLIFNCMTTYKSGQVCFL